jgi:hypothetical protein
MKTNSYFAAACAAALLIPSAAFASHRSVNMTAAQANPETAASTGSLTEDSMAWKVATYPYRAGRTIVRTPLIIGETFSGKRTFVSDRGLFQSNEESAVEQRNSVPKGQGQRSPMGQRAGQ